MIDWAPNKEMCLSARQRESLRRRAKLTADLNRGSSRTVSLDVSCLSARTSADGESDLPRSPMCLSSSVGPPWFFLCGLKWGPAEVHPLLRIRSVRTGVLVAYVLSPNSLDISCVARR